MINFEAARSRYPLTEEDIKEFLNKRIKDPLTTSEIQTEFGIESDRTNWKSLTDGIASLLIAYKGYEVAVASWTGNYEDLTLLQLQGSRSKKSQRGFSGMNVAGLVAQETEELARIPKLGARRIAMPDIYQIEGIDHDSNENAKQRYEFLIHVLSLTWSDEENLYIKDLETK